MSAKKQKKKTSENPSCQAEKLKQQGNTAFANEDFLRAIDLYSQAIELNSANPIYYSNRAAAFYSLNEYEDSLKDANKAIELDDKYLKAYYRRACNLYELDDLEAAIKTCEDAKKISDSEEIDQIHARIKEEIEKDNLLPLTDPEMQKIINLNKWLSTGNAEFSKLKMRFYAANYRGVHARRKIKNKEIILFVPRSHLITLEMAKSTPVSLKIISRNLDLLSPKHSFLSTFLLQELKNSNSFWKPYLEILPKSYDSMPIFFSEEELGFLEGSPFLNQVKSKLSDLRKDYNAICDVAEEFKNYEFKEFCWARTTVASRIFGIVIGELKTDAFVPLADMLNHRRPKQTSWSYSNERGGFVIESLENINKGEQIYDSYGKKCNSRFLLNYGFIVLENDGNEVAVTVPMKINDPLIKKKEQFVGETIDPKVFRISIYFDEVNVSDFFGFVRFSEIWEEDKLLKVYEMWEKARNQEEDEDAEKEEFKPQKTLPISIENEKRTLETIRTMCKKSLESYKTTLEEDLQMLKSDKLTVNQRNCIYLRSGEKEILHFYIEMADKVLPLFDMTTKETRRLSINVKYAKFADYINKILLPLMLKSSSL